MRYVLSFLPIFLISVLNSTAQYIPVPEGSSLSLNGTWKFNPSPDNAIFSSPAMHSGWKDIKVPGEWTMQGFEVKKGVRAAYQTAFNVPAGWKGKSIILRFDGVYSDATVWINGRKATSHIGGFNVFESDITPLVRKGQNTLTVGVTNESIADTLSCGSQYAAHPLGGIPRKVTVYSVPEFHIADIFIKTNLDEKYINARLQLEMSLISEGNNIPGGDLKVDLIAPDDKIIASRSQHLETKGKIFKETIEMDIENPLKWNCEYPNLYKLRLNLSSKAGTEVIERKIGFRKLEIAGNRLFLNGSPVKLHGINRHEVHPLTGRSLNMELWRKDVMLYKEANINYIRTSHYPPPEEFISLCDSAGIYVELENPLVWIGHSSNLSLSLQEAWDIRLRKELLKTTRETITFYRNHPAIIFWSLANESAWTDNWKAVHAAADSIDPTRPETFHDQAYGPSNNYGSTSMPIANIHYPGPGGPEYVENYDRPVLFGEYCHLNTYNRQEIATDPGVRDSWVKGFNRMWEKIYRSEGCLGGAIWSGIDDAFMLPDGRLVGYGEWGPIDGWRRLKPEYYHIRKTYCPVKISVRKTNLTAGNEVLLPVENRYDFTDLKDCRFEYEIGEEKGKAEVSVKPHNSGLLKLGPFNGNVNGKTMIVRTYSPGNLLIDESSVDIGDVVQEKFPWKMTHSEEIRISEDQSLIRISSADVKWIFNKETGKIMMCSVKSDTVINAGADLMILPLHSEECKTEHSLNIPVLNNTCINWKLISVSSAKVSDTVKINVQGRYNEADITMEYCFLKGGSLLVKYSLTMLEDINPRQVGLVFSVPATNDNLAWYRKGFWSSYPEWHIGRTSGNATSFPPDAFELKRFGTKPENAWKLDANALGTNDFRSTKENIYWASLTNKNIRGIAALSDGRQSFRSYVNGRSVNFLLADYSNGGGEMFFASHLESERRPLHAGDRFSGQVILRIISGD